MIKCKGNGECADYGDRCCYVCPEKETCSSPCLNNPHKCSSSVMDEAVETTDLTLFQTKAIAIMQEIADLDRMKKQLEAKDKVVRQELQEAMDKYGIKKFENDILKVTYVEPTTRSTIDSKRLKEELPAIAEKYTKTTVVKGSVRIEVK